MEITFLGTGPATPLRGNGKNYRSNTSALIKLKDKNVLIDASPMIMEQLFMNAVDNIDAILLTHSHHTCVKGLPYCSENFKNLPVYALKQTFNIIDKYYKDLDIIKNVIEPDKEFKLFGESILPVRVNHTESFDKTNKHPCVAYKLKNTMYAPSMESIPETSSKHFNLLDNLIVDASMYFNKKIKGHLSLEDSINIANTYKPKKLILTHIGSSYPDYYKAEKKIEDYCNLKGFKLDIKLAYDGMSFGVDIKKLGKKLDNKLCIYLESPLPEELFDNKRKYFFRGDKLTNLLNKNLYLVDESFCYGIVELTNIIEIKPKDLERVKAKNKELKDLNISDILGGSKKMYAYEVKIMTKFPRKKSIKIKGKKENFSNPFEFVK